MARLDCVCGNLLSNVCFPNELEGNLRSTYGYKDRSVWECPECGRLAIDLKDMQGYTIVKWYDPEDGKVGNLFEVGTADDFLNHLKHFIKWHKKDIETLFDLVLININEYKMYQRELEDKLNKESFK